MPEVGLVYKLAFDMVIVGLKEEGRFRPSFCVGPELFDDIMKAWDRFRPTILECQRMLKDGATIESIKMFLDEMGQEMAVIE